MRKIFTEEIFRAFAVHSLTVEIAMLAGQIEGQQAAVGKIVPFQDLVIGATALFLGHSVGSLNVKHFRQIPGLSVVAMS